MVKYKLYSEEQEILDAFEKGQLQSVPNVEQEIFNAKETARQTFKKNKRVNLRMTENDFEMAHVKTLEEGIPYQTLLSSIIHKYLINQLVEKK
ncbi:MAG: antitoxin [SAR324 cluster bacterium]|nr:antitoxin [SAR324 cluster bacterium]